MVRKTSPGWWSKLCIQKHITLIKTLRGWNVWRRHTDSQCVLFVWYSVPEVQLHCDDTCNCSTFCTYIRSGLPHNVVHSSSFVYWGEPERAPHRRVCCGICLYYILLFLVRRAVSHLQLLFCVHMSTFNFSWLLTCTPRCLQLIACMKCSVNVTLHFFTAFSLLCGRVSWILQAPQALRGTKKRDFDVGENVKGPPCCRNS